MKVTAHNKGALSPPNGFPAPAAAATAASSARSSPAGPGRTAFPSWMVGTSQVKPKQSSLTDKSGMQSMSLV